MKIHYGSTNENNEDNGLSMEISVTKSDDPDPLMLDDETPKEGLRIYMPRLTPRKKRNLCLILGTIIAVLIVVGGLTAFFLWPRDPSLSYNNIKDISVSFTPNIAISFTEWYEIDNTNFVTLDVKGTHLAVYHQGISLGLWAAKDKSVDLNSSEELDLPIQLNTSMPTVAIDAIKMECATGTTFTLDFDGWLGMEYLVYTSIFRTRYSIAFPCAT